ncbi:13280_t:CDS:2 [Ambispora leptoticha]|uniref:13280_t:CDS:1 n=1 Tax=Ambispora leptoticha TaxID=144679 RepID=A0A9N9FZJ7_9GLOM|nr:13280_t:CDS:2 [Ambispora leptoticha]
MEQYQRRFEDASQSKSSINSSISSSDERNTWTNKGIFNAKNQLPISATKEMNNNRNSKTMLTKNTITQFKLERNRRELKRLRNAINSRESFLTQKKRIRKRNKLIEENLISVYEATTSSACDLVRSLRATHHSLMNVSSSGVPDYTAILNRAEEEIKKQMERIQKLGDQMDELKRQRNGIIVHNNDDDLDYGNGKENEKVDIICNNGIQNEDMKRDMEIDDDSSSSFNVDQNANLESLRIQYDDTASKLNDYYMEIDQRDSYLDDLILNKVMQYIQQKPCATSINLPQKSTRELRPRASTFPTLSPIPEEDEESLIKE